jgi:hypothetical protein
MLEQVTLYARLGHVQPDAVGFVAAVGVLLVLFAYWVLRT